MKKNSFNQKARLNTRSTVIMGVMIAMEIILSRFVSISAWNIKIGFGFLPIAITAILLGPVKAGIAAAASDFLGAVLFPIGTYFPGFTLTAFFTGIVFGLFLYKKQTPVRVLLAAAVNQLLLSQVVNTYCISVLYGSPYYPLFVTRIAQTAIMIPVQIITILIVLKFLTSRQVILTE